MLRERKNELFRLYYILEDLRGYVYVCVCVYVIYKPQQWGRLRHSWALEAQKNI